MLPKMYRKTKPNEPDNNRFKENDGGGIFQQIPNGPVSSIGHGEMDDNPNVEEIDRKKPSVNG